MKGLSITGFIISILVFLLAMYLQFVVTPSLASLERMKDYGDGSNDLARMMWAEAHSFQVKLSQMTLVGAILPLILCIIPALKRKSKLAWVGVVLTLLAVAVVVIGAR